MPRDYINQPPTAYQRRPHLTRDEDWIRVFLKEAPIGRIATSVNGQPFINTSTFWFDEEQHDNRIVQSIRVEVLQRFADPLLEIRCRYNLQILVQW